MKKTGYLATQECRGKRIENKDELKECLQWALELEHATIPPYLCALYSIPDGKNTASSALIRSVVMEEMLHMVLVANLLNAIGGVAKLSTPGFIPSYPGPLPRSDGNLTVNLLPFSRDAIHTFRRIEHPSPAGAEPMPIGYHTIGEFYLAIHCAFVELSAKENLFTGHRSRQITRQWFYGGGGDPIEVHDLPSALLAIAEICEQGEGYNDTIWDNDQQFGQVDELAHYFRFSEIHYERRYTETDTAHQPPSGGRLLVDWDARYPMCPNPKMKDFEHQPEIHALMHRFNERYSALLRALEEAFTGKPAALMPAVPIMYELKYAAQALMAIPSGRGDGTTAGPSFEYIP